MLRRWIFPALGGLLFLMLEYFYLIRFSMWGDYLGSLLTSAVLSAGAAALAVVIVRFGHGYTGCGVFCTVACGGVMMYYALFLLTNSNFWLSNDSFLPAFANWFGITAVCITTRIFDRSDRFAHFERFFAPASVVFIIYYLGLLAYELFLKNDFFAMGNIHYRAVNLVPFKTISTYLHFSGNRGIAVENLLGNLLLFIPFGFFLKVFSDRIGRALRIFLLFAFPAVMEVLQYWFAVGSTDIDDVLLDALSGFIGILICMLLELFYRRLHPDGKKLFIFEEEKKQPVQKAKAEI